MFIWGYLLPTSQQVVRESSESRQKVVRESSEGCQSCQSSLKVVRQSSVVRVVKESSENRQRVVREQSESLQRFVRELPESRQRVVKRVIRELSESRQRVIRESSDSCQRESSKSCQESHQRVVRESSKSRQRIFRELSPKLLNLTLSTFSQKLRTNNHQVVVFHHPHLSFAKLLQKPLHWLNLETIRVLYIEVEHRVFSTYYNYARQIGQGGASEWRVHSH